MRLYPCHIKLILFFCSAIYFFQSNKLIAQTTYQLPPNQPEQDACNALQLCNNSFYTPYSYTGTGKKLDLDTTPCFSQPGGGEKNSVWLQIHIATAGNLVFKIKPVDPDDDYDFAVLNITGKNCSSLTLNEVVRCNYNSNLRGSNMNGEIGLSDTGRTLYAQSGAFGGSFCQAVFARSNEVYLIMVNNFGNYVGGGPSKGFTIDFTGSTATFYNTDTPELKSIDEQCNSTNSIVVKLSTQILCSSIAADGSDFITNVPAKIVSASGVNCNDRGGYTNSIVINFSSPLPAGNYTISAKKGSDNNTLAGLCNNELLLPSKPIPFIIKPGGKVAIDDEFVCYQQLPYIWNGKQLNKGGDSVASYTTASAAGCDSTTILNLYILQAPQQVSLSKTICDGDSYVLPWGSPINTAGTYVHHYTNMNGCDSVIESVTVTVFIPSSGNVDARDSTIETGFCENGSALLSTGSDFKTYIWNTGQTSSSIIVNIAGTYSLMATDKDGCVTIDTFVVARYQYPAAAFKSVENLCNDSSVTLDAGTGSTFYLWNNGSTDETITTTKPGTFWVALASAHNCTATDTVNVVAVQRPANFLIPSVTKCSYQNVTLLPSNTFSSYTWSNGTNTKSINVSTSGLYWLSVTDYNGCTGKDSITVKDSICPEYFFIPNAFTPNNDGLNDMFRPIFAGTLSGFHFFIYNRWGRLIFSTNNAITGWDGTVNGDPQPLGIYVWVCSYSLNGEGIRTERGTVTLIR